MEETLSLILKSIVDKPEMVDIKKDEVDYSVTFTVTLDQTDIGKVIGKSGRTIKAIRSILKILAATQRKWVNIEVAEATS